MTTLRVPFFVVCALLTASLAWGACGDTYCSGSTCTATDATYTHVNGAIQEGLSCSGTVTVNIPSGTQTWSSTVTMALASATATTISIVGAGIDSTIIQANASPFNITGSAGKVWKLGNFTLNVNHAGNCSFCIYGTTQGWRLYSIKSRVVTSTVPTRLINVGGYTYGSVDGHDFSTSAYWQFITVDSDDWASYKRSFSWGGSDFVVIENNEIYFSSGPSYMFDCERGGRAVVRYNNIRNIYYASHGFETGSTASCMAVEWYNNTITIDGNQWSSPGNFGYSRGGNILLHHNSWVLVEKDADEPWFTSYTIPLRVHRETNDAGPNGTYPDCNGTQYKFCSNLNSDWSTSAGALMIGVDNTACAPYTAKWKACSNNRMGLCESDGDCSGGTCTEYVDGTAGSGSYPCFMQAGFGTNMAASPSYSWSNVCNGGLCGTDRAIHLSASIDGNVQENRDFYKSSYSYTVYTCPHPLVGAGTCSATVAGRSGYSLTGGGDPPAGGSATTGITLQGVQR